MNLGLSSDHHKRVAVLLSVYNPSEGYFKELLSSLKSQTHPISLFVRVDGKASDAFDVKKLVCSFFSDARVIFGSNVGAARSFMSLLDVAVCERFEYFAFCDQDDVWKGQKIARAVLKMQVHDAEVYCSAVSIVDKNLTYVCGSERPKRVNFANALAENIIYGCTLVVSVAVAKDLLRREIQTLCMHDSYIYLYATARSILYVDDVETLLYRQHNDNVVGASHGLKFHAEQMKRFLVSLSVKKVRASSQLEAFLENHSGILSKQDAELACLFLQARNGFMPRLKIIYFCRRNRFIDQIKFIGKAIFGIL